MSLPYESPPQPPARAGSATKAAIAVLGLLTAVLALFTGFLALQTESLKNRQERTSSQVEENEDRTKELERQVNDQSTDEDVEALAKSLSGTWKGTYRCAQGLTGLNLTIWVEPPATLLATFSFYPDPSNPEVPRGAFAMHGRYSGNHLDLTQDYWIEEPEESYRMVDLAAPISSGTVRELEGNVISDTNGCHNFAVRKISTKTSKPRI
jgi:hypothetical protein